jgi:hypothetical protein
VLVLGWLSPFFPFKFYLDFETVHPRSGRSPPLVNSPSGQPETQNDIFMITKIMATERMVDYREAGIGSGSWETSILDSCHEVDRRYVNRIRIYFGSRCRGTCCWMKCEA